MLEAVEGVVGVAVGFEFGVVVFLLLGFSDPAGLDDCGLFAEFLSLADDPVLEGLAGALALVLRNIIAPAIIIMTVTTNIKPARTVGFLAAFLNFAVFTDYILTL
jgi:hypothetical protein